MPVGWAKCSLTEFTRVVMGQSPSSDTYNHAASGLPFFQGKAEFGQIYPRVNKYCSEPNKIAEPGATLLSVRAPVGPTNLAHEKCCIGRGLAAIHPLDHIDPKFLLLLFRSIESDISDKGTGSTFKAVTKAFVENLRFALPPLNEQRRIIAKIDEIFSELDKGVESLQTAREQLKVYRQAVLKHAFEGKLTEQWRKNNKDGQKTPEELLVRIERQREAEYQRRLAAWQTAVNKWEKNGSRETKPLKPRTPKQVSPITVKERDSLPPLPTGWEYLRLGTLIDEPAYGTSKRCDYDIDGIGVLRIPNVVQGKIDATDLKFARFEDNEIEAYRLQAGDVLTIRSNGSLSLVGRCALVSSQEERYLYAGYLIRLRPNRMLVNPSYLLALLSSHFLRSQIEGKAKSTSGVNNINAGEIQDLIIPYCSSSEQEHLIGSLAEALSSIDATESEIAKELERSVLLRQAILKKAFSGQLVAQDPNDEPASILLGRIEADKARAVSPSVNGTHNGKEKKH